MSKTKKYSKIDNSLLNQTISLIPAAIKGTDPNLLPFQEWIDQDVKYEKFDGSVPKDKKLSIYQEPHIERYEDPQDVKLPLNLTVHQWKTPSELFPKANFVVFVNRSTFPDLTTPNGHLLHSEFMRSLISSLACLLYLGNVQPLPVEYTSPVCAPPEKPWKPWHHIYSNNHIEKGQEHTPTVNHFGKYLLRLFWLGSWRKIYIDDHLPVDKDGKLLLPSLQLPQFQESEEILTTSKKPAKPAKGGKRPTEDRTIELWPMLLTKALLKLASLSSYCKNETEDFDIVQCLTGWIPQRIPTKGLELCDIWDITSGYCNNFKWSKDGHDTADTKTSKSQKNKKIPLAKVDEDTVGHPVMAICNDLRNKEVPQFSPCWSHIFLIHQTRDIPLVKPPPMPEIAFWKKDRWVPWAREKGIIPPEVKPSKHYKIVSPLRAPAKEDAVEEKVDEKAESEVASEKSAAKGKGKKEKPKTGAKLGPDPSIWMEHQTISPHVDTLVIYLAPSRFKSRVKISDVTDEKLYTTKETWKTVTVPLDLKNYRNEPVYLFTDSIDHKLLLLNLSQAGNVDNLNKDHNEFKISSLEKAHEIEVDFCEEILRMNIKKETEQKKGPLIDENIEIKCSEDSRRSSTIILEEYKWVSNSFGECEAVVTTFGSGSILIELPPGRCAFRIWLDSKNSFVADILSDTPFEVCPLDEFLTHMSNESQTLTAFSAIISTNYAKLVKSFGTPEFQENLSIFYNSYKLYSALNKEESTKLHQVFYEKFMRILADNFDSDDFQRAVNVLLMKFRSFESINIYSYLDETPHIDPEICEEDQCLVFIKKMHRAAATIQAFFKGVYVRSLMKHHQQTNKMYAATFERLKKIYTEFFSSAKRNIGVPMLFRMIIEDDRLKDLQKKCIIASELNNVIHLHAIQNSMQVVGRSWVPICRYTFFVNDPNPITIKINLFCDLKYSIIRVFDNDSKKEVKRYTNNVAVEEYPPTLEGYTIFCYGFANDDEKLYWKLTVATKKSCKDNILFSNAEMNVVAISDSYMPNEKNLICRYLVNVQMNTICLTTRLATSYPEVELLLRILTAAGGKIAEISGRGAVVLPLAKLSSNRQRQFSVGSFKKKHKHSKRYSDKSSHSVRSFDSRGTTRTDTTVENDEGGEIYAVEAFVRHDSWPLTDEEWDNVEKCREKSIVGVPERETSSLSARRKVSLKTIAKPYYKLHLVFDDGDVVEFAKDRQKEDEMRKVKLSWYEEDPERYQKSYELREIYLQENTEKRESFEFSKDIIRSNDPNIFKPYRLKPLNCEMFYTKPREAIDLDDRAVKTEEDLLKEETEDLERQEEFEQFQAQFFEDMDDLLFKQKENFEIWRNWFNEIRDESTEMMDEAVELKNRYIRSTLELLDKTKKGKKKADEKKKPKR